MALPRPRTAMLENLRRPVIRGDQDIGKRFVVAQQHVEARPQALDQIGLEQQRLGLGRRGDELHRHRRRDHPRDTRVISDRPRIAGDALSDALGLADIKHLAFRIDHAIDAGAGRGMLDGARDRGPAVGQGAGLGFGFAEIELGQRRRIVVFAQFAGRVDVFLAAAHGWNIGCAGWLATPRLIRSSRYPAFSTRGADHHPQQLSRR
jgi:hypothetical protein